MFKKSGKISYLGRVPTVPEFRQLCDAKGSFRVVIAIAFENLIDDKLDLFDAIVANAIIPKEDEGTTELGFPQSFELVGVARGRGQYLGSILIRVEANATETLKYFDKVEKRKKK